MEKEYSLNFESDELRAYSKRIFNTLSQISQVKIDDAIKIILDTASKGGSIWIIGNGGSAATASHFAADLSRCVDQFGTPIRAISLCDNGALISAIGNDFGFEYIYLKQLVNNVKSSDLLFVISASGNSINLIKALDYCNSRNITSIALTGFDGGQAAKICSHSLNLRTHIGDYGVAEDSHSVVCHYLSSKLRS